MTPEQLHILQHSLGLDGHGRGNSYRNHYAAAPGCDGWDDLQRLCERGLMKDRGKISAWGDLHCFMVTRAGRSAVARLSPPPPKVKPGRQRWLDWLRVADAYYPMKFGEWIKRKLYRREVAEEYWK